MISHSQPWPKQLKRSHLDAWRSESVWLNTATMNWLTMRNAGNDLLLIPIRWCSSRNVINIWPIRRNLLQYVTGSFLPLGLIIGIVLGNGWHSVAEHHIGVVKCLLHLHGTVGTPADIVICWTQGTWSIYGIWRPDYVLIPAHLATGRFRLVDKPKINAI